jgi:hypothetical protein
MDCRLGSGLVSHFEPQLIGSAISPSSMGMHRCEQLHPHSDPELATNLAFAIEVAVPGPFVTTVAAVATGVAGQNLSPPVGLISAESCCLTALEWGVD